VRYRLMSHKQSLRKTYVCWQHAAVINLGAARISNFCHFCPSNKILDNMKHRNSEKRNYSDVATLEALNASFQLGPLRICVSVVHKHVCISVHSVHLDTLDIKNKTYQWRSRDIREVHVLSNSITFPSEHFHFSA